MYVLEYCIDYWAIWSIKMRKLVDVQEIRSQRWVLEEVLIDAFLGIAWHRREYVGQLYFRIKSGLEVSTYYKISRNRLYS